MFNACCSGSHYPFRASDPSTIAPPAAESFYDLLISSLKAGASEVLMESCHGAGDHGNQPPRVDTAPAKFHLETVILSSLATRTGGETMTADSHRRHGHHGHHGHGHDGGDGASAGWDVRSNVAA
jgi:hypothetical protein